MESASAFIDEKIKGLADWRGKTLAKVRGIIHDADPEIVEEWKWVKADIAGDSLFFRHGGIVCTGETYKNAVKMTFAKEHGRGAALKDPSGLFNSSLDGNVRRAIDIHECDKVDEGGLEESHPRLQWRSISRARANRSLRPKPRRAAQQAGRLASYEN